MSRSAAIRRELPASRHIPYAAHVAPEVIITMSGDYVQTFRVGGASFESADDETLNNWHERLNVTWRNIASPNVSLWAHLIRRRDLPRVSPARGEGFAARLAQRYQGRLAAETLMANDLYLTLLFRPITGAAPSFVSKILASRRTTNGQRERADALETCAKLRQTVAASLARYYPESLGVYIHSDRRFSSLLEFLASLINGEFQRIPLPRAPISQVLATTRLLFGNETIEYRLPSQVRFGAVLGIKEYPTPTVVGMYNGLLSAPFPFVLTQSFTFLNKATGQGLLQRQHVRMANAGDFAISQAEELVDALDALTSNEFVMGDHHFTLQVLADASPTRGGDPVGERMKRLNDAVALARTLLADTGMTVAREDLA